MKPKTIEREREWFKVELVKLSLLLSFSKDAFYDYFDEDAMRYFNICSPFFGHLEQGAGKSAVLNSLIGHPVLVS